MVGVLKGIGYLILAVGVLTALFSGVFVILVIGIVFGLVLNVVSMTVFTAASLKALFRSEVDNK